MCLENVHICVYVFVCHVVVSLWSRYGIFKVSLWSRYGLRLRRLFLVSFWCAVNGGRRCRSVCRGERGCGEGGAGRALCHMRSLVS